MDHHPPILEQIKEGKKDHVLEHLRKWHYPGQHESYEVSPWGGSDDTYRKGNYILAWNVGLGYVSLQYEISEPVES